MEILKNVCFYFYSVFFKGLSGVVWDREAFIWVWWEKFLQKVSCADVDEAARVWRVSVRTKRPVLRKLTDVDTRRSFLNV